jgi:hypothetical protein
MLELECQAFASTTSIDCKSRALPDESYYTLRGQMHGPEMDGNLTFHSGEPSRKSQKFAFRGGELDKKPPATESLPNAKFSNVEYLEDAGDLVGCELLIFHVTGRPSGIVVFYVGYWGEPIYTSLPLLNVHADADRTIEFELKLLKGIGKYRLTPSKGKELILLRRDALFHSEAEPIKLAMQSHLLPPGPTARTPSQ